jgi:hypothetical protein
VAQLTVIQDVVSSMLPPSPPSPPFFFLQFHAPKSNIQISDPDTWSYGNDFNNNQGGVWAMQWEDSGMYSPFKSCTILTHLPRLFSKGIYIWLWSRNTIPGDIKSNQPNPATWPAPRGR